jgi:head-tail adaptor
MISLLRKRIEILSPTRNADEAGGASLAWSVAETMWAGLERLPSIRDGAGTGRLRRIAVTIRYRNVAIGQRVRHDAVDYEIVSIETRGDREKTLTLFCEEARS